MGLRDLTFASETVKTPGGSFTVRGLSFADVVTLGNIYGPQAALIFGQLVGGENKVDAGDVRAVLMKLAPQVPELVTAVIALAADDFNTEGLEAVRKLGFQYQLDALEKIFRATFVSELELKKFVESVIRMITGATGALNQIRLQPSDLGFSAFDAASAFASSTATPKPGSIPSVS